MKYLMVIALATASLASCEDRASDQTKTDTMDTSSTMNTVPPGSVGDSMNVVTPYTPVDGDVVYRDNKVRVMKNGSWVDADNDLTLDNGMVVNRDGHVIRDHKHVELHEGEVVNRSGDFFDQSGRAINNAWDDAKEGVKDAGRAVKNAAKKVGDKAENAVDNDNK